MVGVPGKSKGCSTCRRRKKGVCSLLPTSQSIADAASVTRDARSVDNASPVDTPVEVMNEREPLSFTRPVGRSNEPSLSHMLSCQPLACFDHWKTPQSAMIAEASSGTSMSLTATVWPRMTSVSTGARL
jgi:hypothetical protein